MTDATAINIALIPDQAGTDKLVAFNHGLSESNRLLLSSDHHLPHLTVAMAVLQKPDILELSQRLVGLEWPEQLFVTEVNEFIRQGADPIWYASVFPASLLMLHDQVMDVLADYASIDPRPEHFAEDVNSSIMDYLNQFDEHARNQYDPHITLGYGQPSVNLTLPFSVKVQWGIFYLGNHGRCIKPYQF